MKKVITICAVICMLMGSAAEAGFTQTIDVPGSQQGVWYYVGTYVSPRTVTHDLSSVTPAVDFTGITSATLTLNLRDDGTSPWTQSAYVSLDGNAWTLLSDSVTGAALADYSMTVPVAYLTDGLLEVEVRTGYGFEGNTVHEDFEWLHSTLSGESIPEPATLCLLGLGGLLLRRKKSA